MNQNVTASFGLSVVIVLFFAVALYHPDAPPISLKPAPIALNEAPTPLAQAQAPATSPLPAAARADIAARSREGVPTAAHVPAPQEAPITGRSVAQTVSRRQALPVARGAFTRARDGESLADVAQRIYGSSNSAQTLWTVNRDVLERPDSPLPAGALLRTP